MNIFVKMVAVVILVTAALIGISYIEGSMKSARVADITVFIDDQNESMNITHLEGSLENVSKTGLPQGGVLTAPGVAVTLRQNMRAVSGWYSFPLNGSGTYTLRIGLYDSFSEDKPTVVYMQAVDSNSQKIISVQRELMLKYKD